MGVTCILANPYAGAGKFKRLWPRLEEKFRKEWGAFDLQLSQRPGHLTELARDALGTGGDFQRTVAGWQGERRLIDVGFLECGRDFATRRYFINVASFGSSGAIVDRVNRSSKRWGAKVSFLSATVRTLATYKNQPVRITLDDKTPIERIINVVAIANGRYFGGGMHIAPNANPEDGGEIIRA